MSSPCLLRAAPISQPRLREVKISLKASPRESVAVRTSGSGVSTSSRAYVQTFEKDPPALRVSLSSSRSRSTPPVHKSTKKSPRGTVKEPEHHPERNGTLLHVPVSATPLGHSALSSSSSSSSSCTPRRQRDRSSPPAAPPDIPLHLLVLLLGLLFGPKHETGSLAELQYLQPQLQLHPGRTLPPTARYRQGCADHPSVCLPV